MAITKNIEPPKINLSSLIPINFKLTSNNQVETAGVKSTMRITFSASTTAEDQEIPIEFGDTTLTFISKSSPDNSGLQFKHGDPSPFILHDWVERTYTYLIKNYLLTKYFDVAYTSGNVYIDITAKDYGTAYSLDLGTPYAGVSKTSSTAGVYEVIRDFFELRFLTMLKNGTSYIQYEDLKPVDADGVAWFDVSQYLQERTEPSEDFKFPDDATLIEDRTDLLKEFYCRYCENYGNPPVAQGLTDTNAYYALPGGISKALQAILNEGGDYVSWHDIVSSLESFLSWHPLIRETGTEELHKLFYLVTGSGITSIKMYVTVNFADGSSQTELKETKTSVTQYKLYEISTSHDTLAIADFDTTKIPESYQLQLKDQSGNIISETRTYEISYQAHRFKRYFIFRNSLGVYDTIRCTGAGITELELDRFIVEQFLPEGYLPRHREKKQIQADASETIKCDTGWIYAENQRWALEFLLSNDVFEVDLEHERIFPISITTKKFKLKDDEQSRFKFDFEYERTAADVPVSALPEGDFNNDFNNDFNIY